MRNECKEAVAALLVQRRHPAADFEFGFATSKAEKNDVVICAKDLGSRRVAALAQTGLPVLLKGKRRRRDAAGTRGD